MGFNINYLKLYAAKGDADAMFSLGMAYYLGKGGAKQKNFNLAVKWFTEAAKKEHREAQFNLGVCYYNGDGVEKNLETAFDWFKQSADQDYADAQFQLGLCYYFGYGVKKDLKEAVRWFNESAKRGCSEAQHCLGICYRDGEGADKDPEKAFYWFDKSKDLAESQFDLGLCFFYGNGTDKDAGKAFDWIKSSADQKNANAQCAMGIFFENGLGNIPENEETAKEWYTKSAEQGFAAAQYQLSGFYKEGKGGLPKDTGKAAELYQKAAEQGFTDAQFEIGCCYEYGDGVGKDYNEAIINFTLAADKGHSNALRHLNSLRDTIQITEQLEQEIERRKELENENKELKRNKTDFAEIKRMIKEGFDKQDKASKETNEKQDMLLEVSKETNETVKRIDENVIKLMEMLPSKIDELRESLKKQPDFEDVFIEKACKMINEALKGNAVEETEKYLEQRFGGIWEKLHHDTQKSLISSWAMWEEFRSNKDFDFSGVVICATGALENELKRIFYTEFKGYRFRNYHGKTPIGRLLVLVKKPFSLGRITFLFGKYDDKLNFSDSEQSDFSELREEFLKSVMRPGALKEYPDAKRFSDCFTQTFPGSDSDIEASSEDKELFEKDSLVAKIDYIRNDFRNPSAHTGNISQDEAQKCCDLIFSFDTEQKMEEINSVLIQFHKLLKENQKENRNDPSKNNRKKH